MFSFLLLQLDVLSVPAQDEGCLHIDLQKVESLSALTKNQIWSGRVYEHDLCGTNCLKVNPIRNL